MNLTTISIIAISYVSVVFLVLKTFHHMRDRNMAEPKFHRNETNYKQSA